MELSAQFTSFPARSWGMTEQEFLATQPRVSELSTPLLTLDRGAMAHNVAVMREWTAQRVSHSRRTARPRWRSSSGDHSM